MSSASSAPIPQTKSPEVVQSISEYRASPNKVVGAANGVDYAYRDAGEGAVALVLLQHFRGNLDNWDPALIDALASARRVVTFDTPGWAVLPELRRTSSSRWRTTPSPSSPPWGSVRSISSGSPSAASSPRRSR